jgi:hypothetical protein
MFGLKAHISWRAADIVLLLLLLLLDQFEAALCEASQRLTSLEELVLCFNNPAQQFETRQLAVLASLPTLKALTVQVRVPSGMHVCPATQCMRFRDSCNIVAKHRIQQRRRTFPLYICIHNSVSNTAWCPAACIQCLQANFHPEACNFGVLGGLTRLSSLTVLPSEASTGLTDTHVASLGLLASLASLEFPGHARAFTGRRPPALHHAAVNRCAAAGWLCVVVLVCMTSACLAHVLHKSCQPHVIAAPALVQLLQSTLPGSLQLADRQWQNGCMYL